MSQSRSLAPEVVEALLERERLAMVGRLLSGVAHNLSGAVQLVRMPLDLLEMQLEQGGSPDLTAKMPTIQEGINRFQSEVEFLALRSGQQLDLSPRRFSLTQMAREQLDFWRADMFFKHQVELDNKLDSQDQSFVYGSYANAALAFNLLLANALEALKLAELKGLGLSLRREQGVTGLLISDQGPGPDPALGNSIFEPFVGDKGPDHAGLGLFLARAALEPAGGGVRLVADQGFFMYLPDSADL